MDLAAGAVEDFDPEGDGKESEDRLQNAIDGNRTTAWDTETYRNGLAGVGKKGVGLYVDAGSPIAARQLGRGDLHPRLPGRGVRRERLAGRRATSAAGPRSAGAPR